MFHVELRQFPHNFCRFNLTERELCETVLDAWAHGEWIELGERKWSPHQANLTVLEGPQLPLEQLSMGRGWRNAGRQSQDVTERMLATARGATGMPGTTIRGGVTASSAVGGAEEQSPRKAGSLTCNAGGVDSAIDVRLAADSLSLEVLTKLGEEPLPPTTVWQLARERYPEKPASDCLKLAEYAIRSLFEARLAVLLIANETGAYVPCAPGEQIERVFHEIDSWASVGDSVAVLIRRA